MELDGNRFLPGPNIWTRCPVLVADLDLRAELHRGPDLISRGVERLLARVAHAGSSGNGQAHDLFGQSAHVTELAAAIQHVALELQSRAGTPVRFGHCRQLSRDGRYRVVIECEEEALGRACLETACSLCLAELNGQPGDLEAELSRLRDLAHEVRLGPSTGSIVRAARSRGIPVRRLNEGSLVQLGHGSRRRLILAAETDHTSAIAETIAQDKDLTRSLLYAAGVPVPEGRPVRDADDAWEAAEEIGAAVVVKPRYGNQGRGVVANLTTREQVTRAYELARCEGPDVLVEQFAPGADYRLLVVGERLVAAALREPAQVRGDGRSSVADLVALVNRDPRRSDGHATSLSLIKLDAVGLALLAEQGYTPESVPLAGARVLIRRNANLSTGGTAEDVTDLVHPDVAARAVEAARAVGLDIAGVDVVATDVSRPLEAQRGVIVEVNAAPGLRMHLDPSAGKPRAVGEAIVDLLFPAGQTGRIPIVVVAANESGSPATRMIADLLQLKGRGVGLVCSEGAFVAGRQIAAPDKPAVSGTHAILSNPRVDVAVIEVTPAEVIREGLGFDRCQVVVFAEALRENFGSWSDPVAAGGLRSVVRTVLETVDEEGTVVLNAKDAQLRSLVNECPADVLHVCDAGENATPGGRRTEHGRAVFVRDGFVVLAEGDREETLMSVDGCPPTHLAGCECRGEQFPAALAAVWLVTGSVKSAGKMGTMLSTR